MADCLPVEETILIIAKASESVLGEVRKCLQCYMYTIIWCQIDDDTNDGITFGQDNFQLWLNQWGRNLRKQRKCGDGLKA